MAAKTKTMKKAPAKKSAKAAAKPAMKTKAKPAAKGTPKAMAAKPARKILGKITHFYQNISVAVVEVSSTIKVGDKISIEGHGNIVKQAVESMQIEHEQVPAAKPGQSVGMRTKQPVKEGDLVFAA